MPSWTAAADVKRKLDCLLYSHWLSMRREIYINRAKCEKKWYGHLIRNAMPMLLFSSGFWSVWTRAHLRCLKDVYLITIAPPCDTSSCRTNFISRLPHNDDATPATLKSQTHKCSLERFSPLVNACTTSWDASQLSTAGKINKSFLHANFAWTTKRKCVLAELHVMSHAAV